MNFKQYRQDALITLDLQPVETYKHPAARVPLRKLFYYLTGTTTLNAGKTVPAWWREARTRDLKFRWYSKPPGHYGWHQDGKVSVVLAPDITYHCIAETMLHELVHAVSLTNDLDGHPEAFYQILTLAAQEAFDMPESVELTGDDQLTYWLESHNWVMPHLT